LNDDDGRRAILPQCRQRRPVNPFAVDPEKLLFKSIWRIPSRNGRGKNPGSIDAGKFVQKFAVWPEQEGVGPAGDVLERTGFGRGIAAHVQNVGVDRNPGECLAGFRAERRSGKYSIILAGLRAVKRESQGNGFCRSVVSMGQVCSGQHDAIARGTASYIAKVKIVDVVNAGRRIRSRPDKHVVINENCAGGGKIVLQPIDERFCRVNHDISGDPPSIAVVIAHDDASLGRRDHFPQDIAADRDVSRGIELDASMLIAAVRTGPVNVRYPVTADGRSVGAAAAHAGNAAFGDAIVADNGIDAPAVETDPAHFAVFDDAVFDDPIVSPRKEDREAAGGRSTIGRAPGVG